MIHIKRSPVPTCLKKDGISEGDLETNRAIRHISAGLPGKFSFEAYKLVKDDLVEMFHGKCAYCESKITHAQYPHIEHYRPKGYVENGNIENHGYYWLGSDWDNLLLACQICNGQEYKGNNFPISNLNNRVMLHTGNIEIEEPLLINPCVDENPEDHFVYEDKGEMIGKDDKGRVSIKYYGLAREELRKRRAEHLLELSVHLSDLKLFIELYDESQNPRIEDRIREKIRYLSILGSEYSQFSSMTRDYVHKNIFDLDIIQNEEPAPYR